MGMEIPSILKTGGLPDVALKGEHGAGERTIRTETAPPASLNRPALESQMRTLEKTFLAFNHRVKLSINEVIDQLVIKVVDSDTDKLIKEIPPEEIQHMIAKIKETIGLLVDQKI
jgi:flagellar protein FlaG